MSRMLNDFLAAELGDRRLTSRLMVIAAAVAAAPDESLPQRFLDPSELEAAYRFFSRSHTGYDAILAAHAAGTVERSIPAGCVLVLHDTTDFAFVDAGYSRQHLSQVSKNRQGFYAHYSFVVADDESDMPFGTLSMIPYVHRSQVDGTTAMWWEERGGLFANEQERWFQGCETAEAALRSGHVEAIHVCDREGDAYELLSQLVAQDMRFVIRCAQRSRAVGNEMGHWLPLEECLAAAPSSVEERIISVPIEKLSERRKGDNAKSGQQSARPRRKATVRTRWTKVKIRRPQDLARNQRLPGMIDVFVVEVFEVSPPEGLVAASWILYTSEPVNQETEAWQTVDRYRKRWLIEEFFKAIKTGAAYEKRQLATAHALLNMLAVTTLIASDMLVMRACDRVAPDLEAEWLFDPDMIVLAQRLNPKQKFSARPTMAEMLQAVAKLGGHIKQNGPPGWIVLYRGYVKLLEALLVAKQLDVPLADAPSSDTYLC